MTVVPRLIRRSCLAAVLPALAGACSSSSSPERAVEADASTDARVVHPMDARVADVRADVARQADVLVADRKPGERTPLSASCDPIDGTRCGLPWPNNTFTVVDSTTSTGLRVHLRPSAIAAADSAASVNRADGFSRVSPIETGFEGVLDATSLGALTTGAVRLIVEQPGPSFGKVVPVRFDTVVSQDMTESVLVAYPKEPLAPATDYAVVVMDSAKLMGGKALAPNRSAEVALGLAAPVTASEGELYAYDAPARQAMKAAGVDAAHAVRVWDFTTRSLAEPTVDLTTIRSAEHAALAASSFGKAGYVPDAGGLVDASPSDAAFDVNTFPGAADAATGIGLVIDDVSTAVTGTVLASVLGHVTGVPYFLTASGSMNRNAAGVPVALGVHDVPFRAALPTGTGDYRIVMYGHGTGGTYYEDSFDQEITGNGAVKVGTQFIGWTDSTIIDTFVLFARILAGTEITTAGLTQSLADSMLVQEMLGGSLGKLLGERDLGGIENPAAGRHPNVDEPVWAGGSLGGTMGFVYAAAEPNIAAAVLNVPGAAWAQFVVYSELFTYVAAIMSSSNYPDPIDISLGVAMCQLNFDGVDGATWQDAVGDHHALLLEQESMGDPVLPNIGNDMVAVASHADQVGVVLDPIVTCEDVPEVKNHSGMTQFKVPKTVTADLAIHGFAAGTSPAGIAAQQQIIAFIGSVWAGAPAITVPPECESNTPKGSCDFTNAATP